MVLRAVQMFGDEGFHHNIPDSTERHACRGSSDHVVGVYPLALGYIQYEREKNIILINY